MTDMESCRFMTVLNRGGNRNYRFPLSNPRFRCQTGDGRKKRECRFMSTRQNTLFYGFVVMTNDEWHVCLKD